MSSGRTSVLMRIMKLEKEIGKLERDPTYKIISSNLRTLESSNIGSNQIIIESPEDFAQTLTLRRNTDEFRRVMGSYREKLEKYDKKLNELRKEKEGLEKQLFKHS